MDKKIILKEKDSVMELAPILVDKVGLDKSRAGAVINAFARGWHDDLRFVGPLAKATLTTEGRKRILSLKNVGPKSLGYIMRALEFVEIEYDAKHETTELEVKPLKMGIGRVIIHYKTWNDDQAHEIEAAALCYDSDNVGYLDSEEYKKPGLEVYTDPELPNFIFVNDEEGYTAMIPHDNIALVEINKYPVREKPNDLE